jgi:N-methylhydantoinase A
MRYAMQTHSLIVPLPGTQIDEGTMRTLAARFHQIYEDTYGKGAGYTEAGVEVEAIRVEARGRTRKPQIGTVAQGTGESRHVRLVYDGRTKKQMPTSIIQWDDMRIGETVIGPAIIEHPTTTVVVGPGQNATLDDYGNLILREIRSAA